MGLFSQRLATLAFPALTREEELPDSRLDREQSAAMVREVSLKVSFKPREVFVLFEFEGLECKAIAELLAVPEGTVWSRLHEARRQFEALMKRQLAHGERKTPRVLRAAGAAALATWTKTAASFWTLLKFGLIEKITCIFTGDR